MPTPSGNLDRPQSLASKGEPLRALFESLGDPPLALLAPDGRMLLCNAGARRLFGISPDEPEGLPLAALLADPDPTIPMANQALQDTTELGFLETSCLCRRRDGSTFRARLELRALRPAAGKLEGFSLRVRPGNRDQDEAGRAQRIGRLYRVLSEINQLVVEVRDREELLQQACRLSVEQGLFAMTWIGLADHGARKVRPVACHGMDHAYLSAFSAVVNRTAEGRKLSWNAIRKGAHFVCNDIFADPRMAPIHAEARRLGYRASAIFPIHSQGRVVGTLCIFSTETGFFDAEEVGLLEKLAANLSFALEKMDQERQRMSTLSALRESEERFRATFEQAAVGLAHVSPDGHWLRVNQRLCEIVGYQEQELLELTFQEITHSEDLDADLASVQQMLAGEITTYSMDKRFIRKSGEPIWIELTVALVRELQGEPKYFIKVVEDISERKRAEEALRKRAEEMTILNRLNSRVSNSLAPTRVIEAALDDILESLQPDLALFYLLENDQLVLQQDRTSRLSFAREEAAVKQIGNCLCGLAARGKKPIFSHDIRLDSRCTLEECKQAGVRSFAALPLVSAGSLLGVLSIGWVNRVNFSDQAVFLETLASQTAIGLHNALLHDRVRRHAADLEQQVSTRTAELQESRQALIAVIHDLNRKTGELAEANRRLKEVDRLKSLFIASMSHELRTPLNSIIGFSSILLDEWAGPLNEEQKENLSSVLRSGRHLLALINDVIDVSKIEAGQLDIQYQRFNLQEVIDEAVEALSAETAAKGLRLEVESVSLEMFGDRVRLLQCLLNLLSNAVKYTNKGFVRIAATPLHDAGKVEIAVEDSGVGIREQDRSLLLEPFTRLDSPLKKRVPGTGLGLYLTRKLATEVLLGSFDFTSTEGQGSRFTLRVPISAEGA
ncbi:hypothetical protein DESUT3_04980 [Desulfuromonas versatilis]|uniref:histidine kinase n=1 Tax=Desulfuromonas versatilis TaxID=2802975 RepID=A0ABN6DV92_9BACT|nr:PAS domain S-box protein [Desulfuromonas versatilis]BCR03429.1 hypothetical protein DESUT3_04980 [Desulfuromonas versatilis]